MATDRTWKGRLVRADLGTGAWQLEAEDGRRYALAGDIPAELAGSRVEVRGRESGLFGFAMSGPAIQVEEVRRA